jgi:hypothetical protein
MARWQDKVVDLIKRSTSALRNVERGTGRTTRKKVPTTRPVERGLQIEYSPSVDGDPDPGEIVWTWVPYEEDPTRGKDRPVVIIGRRGANLCGVALTSKRRNGELEVGTGPWDPRNRPSYAKVDRLLDIDADTVRREGAALNRRRFDAVVQAVDRLHDVVR